MLMTTLNPTIAQRFQGGILGFVLGLFLHDDPVHDSVNFDLNTHPLWYQFSQGIETLPSVDRPLERSQPASLLADIPWVLSLWGDFWGNDRSVLQNLWLPAENPSLLLFIQGLESLIDPRTKLNILEGFSAVQRLWHQTQSLYRCEVSLVRGFEDLMSVDLSAQSAPVPALQTLALSLGLTLRSRGNISLSLALAQQFNGDRFACDLPLLLPLTGLISGFAFPNNLPQTQGLERLSSGVFSIIHTASDRLFRIWSGCP